MLVARVRNTALTRIIRLVPEFEVVPLGEVTFENEAMTDLFMTPHVESANLTSPLYLLMCEYDVRRVWLD